MTAISPTKDDDHKFVSLTKRILDENLLIHKPNELYLILIDNWFDHKWLKYSGKVEGALPVWQQRTTVPAFSPSRVVIEKKYLYDDKVLIYQEQETSSPLHKYYPNRGSERYYLDEVTNSGIFLWYSGHTKVNQNGSIMLYIETKAHREQWYASFLLKDDWVLNKTKGISSEEIHSFLRP